MRFGGRYYYSGFLLSKNVLIIVTVIGLSILSSFKVRAFDSIIDTDQKVYAIGDIHGNFTALITLLSAAKLIDVNNKWIGNKSIIVQVGDQIDRGEEDRIVIDFFDRLKKEAIISGGDVYSLLGNHELNNARMKFDYVNRDISLNSLSGFKEFFHGGPIFSDNQSVECLKNFKEIVVPTYQSYFDYFSSFFSSSDSTNTANTMTDSYTFVPDEVKGRAAAFCPGGVYAKILASRPTMMIINGTIFVHGGLNVGYAKLLSWIGVDEMNEEVSLWLKNEKFTPRLAKKFVDFLKDDDGPLKYRFFGEENDSEQKCKVLDEVFSLMNAKKMVIGHTIQKFGIESECFDKLWKIDTGMYSISKKNNSTSSSNYKNDIDYKNNIESEKHPLEMLEITPDGKVNIISAKY